MRSVDAQTVERQPRAGLVVALLSCFWAEIGPCHMISGVPGAILGAASFYVLMIFYLKSTGAIRFRREPQVHLGQAALLLFTLAVAVWAKVLLGSNSSLLFWALEWLPLAVFIRLLSGPWKGLLPMPDGNNQQSQCHPPKEDDQWAIVLF